MHTFHVTLSSVGRVLLARGVDQLRALVRALTRSCQGRLLMFSLVDDHAHLLPRTNHPGLLGRELVRAARGVVPGLQLQAPHVAPVESRAHLLRLVDYLLDQPRKHGLAAHPALWEGSCFQDLLGARLLPGFDRTALVAELPRLRLGQLFPRVGLRPELIAPAGPELLLAAGVGRILELAAGVFALPLPLEGHARPQVEARALAAQMALRAGFRPGGIAPLLGLGERGLRKLLRRPVPAEACLALTRRLALELRVASENAWQPGPRG